MLAPLLVINATTLFWSIFIQEESVRVLCRYMLLYDAHLIRPLLYIRKSFYYFLYNEPLPPKSSYLCDIISLHASKVIEKYWILPNFCLYISEFPSYFKSTFCFNVCMLDILYKGQVIQKSLLSLRIKKHDGICYLGMTWSSNTMRGDTFKSSNNRPLKTFIIVCTNLHDFILA